MKASKKVSMVETPVETAPMTPAAPVAIETPAAPADPRSGMLTLANAKRVQVAQAAARVSKAGCIGLVGSEDDLEALIWWVRAERALGASIGGVRLSDADLESVGCVVADNRVPERRVGVLVRFALQRTADNRDCRASLGELARGPARAR